MTLSGTEKLYLSPTAALVMQWASSLYKEGAAREFMANLDLSSADRLVSMCNRICPWYSEVIVNRKFFIKKLINDRMRSYPDSQVVYLGAGLSPLAIEVLEGRNHNSGHFFEIDIHSMESKKKLYEKVVPDISQDISCYHADITSGIFLNLLAKDDDFSKEKPSIIVVEGLSYYLSRKEMGKILSDFITDSRSNFVIVEYLIPYDSITPEKRYIPQQVFGLIKDFAGLSGIERYSADEMKRMFVERGGEIIGHYSMKEMERDRCGENKYFRDHGDWWIECVTGIL